MQFVAPTTPALRDGSLGKESWCSLGRDYMAACSGIPLVSCDSVSVGVQLAQKLLNTSWSQRRAMTRIARQFDKEVSHFGYISDPGPPADADRAIWTKPFEMNEPGE